MFIESTGPLVPPIYNIAPFLAAANRLTNNPVSYFTKPAISAFGTSEVNQLVIWRYGNIYISAISDHKLPICPMNNWSRENATDNIRS